MTNPTAYYYCCITFNYTFIDYTFDNVWSREPAMWTSTLILSLKPSTGP